MPPLHDFSERNGSPSFAAARECCAILGTIYRARREKAEAIPELGGVPAELLVWEPRFPGVTPPEQPGYAVIRQGGRYFVYVAGTQTQQQWLFNVLGSYATRYEDTDALVHRFFGRLDRRLAELLAPVLPQEHAGQEYRFAGHSLGGAVAHLLATRYAQEGANVQCLTFGEPRSLAGEYRGPRPRPHWRFTRRRDIVTQVPPRVTSLVVPSINPELDRILRWWEGWGERPLGLPEGDPLPESARLVYTHGGREVLMLDDGRHQIAEFDTQWLKGADRGIIAAGVADNHPLRRYWEVLKLQWELTGRPGGPVAAAVVANGDISTDPQGAGETIVVDPTDGRLTPVDVYRRLPPQLRQGVTQEDVDRARATVVTVGPWELPGANIQGAGEDTMSTVSGTWLVTLVINQGDYGRTQTFALRNASTFAIAQEKALRLIRARSALLGSSFGGNPGTYRDAPPHAGTAAVTHYTLRDAMNPRVGSLLNVIRADGAGFNIDANGNQPCETPQVALVARMRGSAVDTPTVVRNNTLTFTGVPEHAVDGGLFNKDAKVKASGSPATIGDAWQALHDLLTDANEGWGFLGRPSAASNKDVTGFGLNAEDFLTLTIPGNTFPINSRIRLFDTRKPGFSFTSRVVASTTGGVTVERKFLPGTELPATGKAVLISNPDGTRAFTFYRFERPPAGMPIPQLVIRKRNVARRISAVSFRRSGRRKQA